MAQPLENRITTALRESSRLKDVETTIGDVQAEIRSTDKRREQEEARSVDPALTTPEAREARNNAADLEHDVRRLNASLELLTKRRQTILDDDAYAKRKARYDTATSNRDELAQDIRRRYPVLAMELLTLAKRIAVSDAECAQVNRDRPRGADELVSAEFIARRCGHYWPSGIGSNPVERIGAMSLPLLMRLGNYLPLRTGLGGEREEHWTRGIEADQKEAADPIFSDTEEAA